VLGPSGSSARRESACKQPPSGARLALLDLAVEHFSRPVEDWLTDSGAIRLAASESG
jgi:hypothetical protein